MLRANWIVYLLLGVTLIVSCKEEGKKVLTQKAIRGEAQGTTYNILFYDSTSVDLKKGVDSVLYAIDQSLSTYNPNSILTSFNSSDSCELIDDHFIDVFLEAYKVYDLTKGAFDPTILPVLNAWGFGPVDTLKFDSTYTDSMKYAFIDSLAFDLEDFVGMDMLSLGGDLFMTNTDSLSEDDKDNWICKELKNIQLDFNAIAQGYSVDCLARYLDSQGVSSYLVELGGELRSKGMKPNGVPWRVAIENPTDLSQQSRAAELNLTNRSMATSGNYRKIKMLGNIPLGHTIDPRECKPVNNELISVTVFADDCILADAYSTSFMVMGLYDAVNFVETNRTDNLEAYFIYQDQDGNLKTYVSYGLESAIQNNIATEFQN